MLIAVWCLAHCAAGVIEQNFSPGPFSMQLSSIVYGLTWRFKDEGHPADLKKR
jgi:hypothetical protein